MAPNQQNTQFLAFQGVSEDLYTKTIDQNNEIEESIIEEDIQTND